MALVFGIFGIQKIAGSEWTKLFADIGFGDWFRYFTGAIQVTGAALLLVPRIAKLGAALLASTMAGAILIHLFVLRTGVPAAIVPAMLLAFIVAAGLRGDGSGGGSLSIAD